MTTVTPMSTDHDGVDRWYRTRKQAAEDLHVDTRVIRLMIERGELETVVLGNRSYVLARSIRAFRDRVVLDREPNGVTA